MSEKPDFVQILVDDYVNTGEMPIPQVFRAKHADHIDEIERLQAIQTLQIDHNGRYKVPVRFIRRSAHWPRERRIANKIALKLKSQYRADPLRQEFAIDFVLPDGEPGLEDRDVKRAFGYLTDLGLLRCSPRLDSAGKIIAVSPSESIIKFTDIDLVIASNEKAQEEYQADQGKNDVLSALLSGQQQPAQPTTPSNVAALWLEIKGTYSVSKPQFGKRIAFVKGETRDLIFRDVAHAHGCLKAGFYKSAVVLAGAVIEHLLHRYLEYKGHPTNNDNFSHILKECERHDLVKAPILHLSSAIREFRNLVHLGRETGDRITISKTTATSAVNSIFTISSAFER